ncbi:MAG: AraC family transcriptional regulator [Bacteroidota bacterium]
MKPILEKVTTASYASFALKEDILPHIEIGWHFHPEYELTLIAESHGQRLVGDHIANFEAGDVLLIGPGLPHFMRNDPIFYEKRPHMYCRAIVAHFEEGFLGESFFHIPECQSIHHLLTEAKRGIHVYGASAVEVAQQMEQLLGKRGLQRVLGLLDILSRIASSRERRCLASRGFTQTMRPAHESKIGEIFQYVFTHFPEDLSVRKVAQQVSLSDVNLCKLIKRHTGKTFSQTLNEVRIGHACRLLIEQDFSITEIAFSCGYSSPSYFNRQFRLQLGLTPKEYRQQVLWGEKPKT